MEIGAGLWFIAALIVGIVAAREFGRSGIAWFVLSIVFTPLIGMLLFILPPRRVPCPFCAEPIKPSAVICRFCNRSLPTNPSRLGNMQTSRLVIAALILIGLVLAATRCQYQLDWWHSSDSPLHVSG